MSQRNSQLLFWKREMEYVSEVLLPSETSALIDAALLVIFYQMYINLVFLSVSSFPLTSNNSETQVPEKIVSGHTLRCPLDTLPYS